MAALTKLGSTPNSVRYQLDGNSGGVSKTQAQLLADLDAGPLKEILTRISTNAAWTALTNDLRFIVYGRTIQTVAADDWTVVWSTGGGRNLAFGFGQTGNAYVIDLRFVPTPAA